MSALFALFYYIVVPLLSAVMAWLWLSRAKKPGHKRIARAVCALWFIWLAWMLGGNKVWYDMKVDRLCAKDGGIKVYETVTLPADRFDKWGVFSLPLEKKMQPGDEYYYIRDTHYYQGGSSAVWRAHSQIFRVKDKKLLGETIWYARRGGDLPGPWSNSSYSCPGEAGITKLKKRIFIKNTRKKGETL